MRKVRFSILIRILKWAIFVAAIAVVYFKLIHDKDTTRILYSISSIKYEFLTPTFFYVLILVLVNWMIEAKKWQYLVNRFGKISFGRSFKATIAGTCFSLFTPNRIGEFLGRVLFVVPADRRRAIFATVVGSIAQFLTTILMGCVGIIWFLGTIAPIEGIEGLGTGMILSLSLILLGVCTVIYFQPAMFGRMLVGVKWLKRWRRSIMVLDRYNVSSLLMVLCLSGTRYLVFSTQFVLLLFIFNVDISIANAYASVFLVYLISTVLPTVIFSELGVREVVALSVISVFASNEIGIVAASFIIWVINLLLPAIVGSVIVLTTKVEFPTYE